MVRIVVLIIYFTCMAGCFHAAIRNECVYRFRVKILFTNEDLFDKLPSYKEMMLKFWVWPMKKFIPKGERS